MNWAGIESTISSVVATASEEVSLDVSWLDQPQGFRAERHVKLSIVGFDSLGHDEHRWEDVGDGEIEMRVYGVRTLTVQVTVETRSQTLALSALALADTIRTGLYRQDLRDTLSSLAEIGIAEIGPIRQTNFSDRNSRVRSFATFEVTFNAQSSSAVRALDHIERVLGSGQVEPGAIAIPIDAQIPD